MTNKIKKIIYIGIIGSLAVFAGCSSISSTNTNEIDSFVSCMDAGGDIAESYPRQCFIEDMAFVEELDDRKIKKDSEKIGIFEFSVAPFTMTCQGFHPVDQECLVIDGEFFYEVIEGFDFKSGYEYKIKVEKFKQFSDEEYELVADISQFGYKLIEIISEEKSSKTESDYFEPIPVEQDETFIGEIIEIQNGKDGSTVTIKLDYPVKDGLGEDITEIKSTISIPNLGINSEFDFSDIKVGNKLRVTGQTFKMDGTTHLTAEFAFAMFSSDAKSKCETEGGNYEVGGILQVFNCNMPANDAGETCSDSSECDGLCLADGGVCSVKTTNFGCIPILENGKEVTICID